MSAMHPRYREGWNDRLVRFHDYGKVYRSIGGDYLASTIEVRSWSLEERQEYVRGWNDAAAKILTLSIPEEP